MNIFGIEQNANVDHITAIQRRKNFASETPNSVAKGDTISISPEAMEMYRASQDTSGQTSYGQAYEQVAATLNTSVSFLDDKQSQGNDASIATKITAWYDNFREKMGNVPEPDFSTWAPENLARREELIKERDALAPHTSNKEFTDANRKMNGILDEIMLLDAVGHEQVLSDADIKAGLDALHASMDRWSGDEPGTAAYDAGEGKWIDQSLQREIAEMKSEEALDETFFKIMNRRSEVASDAISYIKSIAIERQGDNDNEEFTNKAVLKDIGNPSVDVNSAIKNNINLDGEQSNYENSGLSNSGEFSEEKLAAAIVKAKQELEEITTTYEEIMSGSEDIEEKFRLGQHVYDELKEKADEVASLEAQAKMQSVKAKGDIEDMLAV